jgi:hypothetical protein
MALQLDKLNTTVNTALIDLVNDSGACPQDFQDILDNSILTLQQVQNSALLNTEQEILDALKQNAIDLVKLNQDIDDYIKKLGATSGKVQKVSGAVDTVISVLGTILSVV